jgi:hypothetical protein
MEVPGRVGKIGHFLTLEQRAACTCFPAINSAYVDVHMTDFMLDDFFFRMKYDVTESDLVSFLAEQLHGVLETDEARVWLQERQAQLGRAQAKGRQLQKKRGFDRRKAQYQGPVDGHVFIAVMAGGSNFWIAEKIGRLHKSTLKLRWLEVKGGETDVYKWHSKRAAKGRQDKDLIICEGLQLVPEGDGEYKLPSHERDRIHTSLKDHAFEDLV